MLTVPFVPHAVPQRVLRVEPGDSLRAALRRAAHSGYVVSPYVTEWIARLRKFDRPRAGGYLPTGRISDVEIARMWHEGRVAERPVTFPEGWTARDMANALSAAAIVAAGDFLRAISDAALLAAYGIPASNAEGYLFPDTYRLSFGTSATTVATTMMDRFFALLPTDFAARATAVGLNPHEAVILASMIQRETFIPEEMPMVSGVFHNRLRRGMRLQSDPTAIYAMPGYNGDLTREILRTPTPYNTYVIRGLPAGPIANPGLDALQSAVAPATTAALYFVAGPNGHHLFATDYRDHVNNVNRWQKRLAKR